MTKLIFITSRFPYPLNKGDKLRVYFQLKYLSKKHQIHLIALNDKPVGEEDLAQLKPFCASINIYIIPFFKSVFGLYRSVLNHLPLQVAFFYNRSVQLKINELIGNIQPSHIHCHLLRTTEYVKNINQIDKSLDFMDAFGVGMEKRTQIENNFFKRLLYRFESRLLLNYEAKVFDWINKFCIISEQDKKQIKSPLSGQIKVIPNGVDFETFYPRHEELQYDLIFMGNLSYPPNIDAVNFLCNEIMPLLIEKKSNIKLLIAGIAATVIIKKYVSANINLIENFKDISQSIAMSKIMVAPMRISIGLQNKIIQAMAMKKPCVVSTLSNNAINAPVGIAIVEANNATEFALSIIDLLDNEYKANKMGENAYKFVQSNYAWEKQNDLFNQLIKA